MADAKTTTVQKATKVSKRKASTASKSKKTKTKLTKETVVVEVKTAVASEIKTEKVFTSRQKRMAEKAKFRLTTTPVVEEPVMGKVRITDVAGVVYDEEEYNEMVAMYDATIQDIKRRRNC